MKSKMTFATVFASICLLGSSMPTTAFAAKDKMHSDAAAKKAKWDDVMKRLGELEAKEKKAASAPAAKRMTSSSNDAVSLTIYGHVNRAMLYHDNGYNSQLRHVDNNVSSTRTRFTANAKLNECFKAGALMELEYISENSAGVDIRNPQNKPAFAIRERLLDAFLDSNFGKISWGQGEMASNRVMDLDYSGTDPIHGGLESQLMAGGTKFAIARGDYDSTNRITTITSVANEILGSKRLDRVRIDTPTYWGLTLSGAHATNERFDFGARYATEINKIKIGAALGYFADKSPRRGVNVSNTATNYYTDAETNTRNTVNYSQLNQWGGSVAVLFPFGLSVNAGYARQDYADQKVTGATAAPVSSPTALVGVKLKGRKDGHTWGVKLGYQAKFFEIGKTCFAGSYVQSNHLRVTAPNSTYAVAGTNLLANTSLYTADNANKSHIWGAYVVQNIDKLGTELYLGFQSHELHSVKVERTTYTSDGAAWASSPSVKSIASYASNSIAQSNDLTTLPIGTAGTTTANTYKFVSHKFKNVNAVMAGMRIKF